MKFFVWLILLIVFCFSDTYANHPFRSPETRNSGLSLNFQWMQLSDTYFSPLRYDGPGVNLKILSVRTYRNFRRHLHLGVKGDYLRNRLDFNAWYVQPRFGWGLTVIVPELSFDNALSYVGGNISATSRIYRFVNENPDLIYWATSYTLDFQYFFDVEINRERKIFLELNIPLAGMISRPSANNHYTYQLPGFGEHLKRLHENAGFATLDKMQSANLKLIMDLSNNRRQTLSLGYEVDFSRFNEPEPVSFLSNSLFLRFYFNAFVW